MASGARHGVAAAAPATSDAVLLRALLAGFPDRVARRREPRSPRLVLASGHGRAARARERRARGGAAARARDHRRRRGAAGRGARGRRRRWCALRAASSARGSRTSRRSSSTASTRPRAPCGRSPWTATTAWCSASGPCRPIPRRRPGCWPRRSSAGVSGRRRSDLRARLRVAGLDADLHAAVRRGLRRPHQPAAARRSGGAGWTRARAGRSTASRRSGCRCPAAARRGSSIARTARSRRR